MHPSKVHAQFTPSCYVNRISMAVKNKLNLVLTLVNNWTVKRGNAAAVADRTTVFAANAEALYILQSTEKNKKQIQ